MQIILGAVFHGVCKGERDGSKRGAAITGSNPQQTSFTEGYSTITAAPPPHTPFLVVTLLPVTSRHYGHCQWKKKKNKIVILFLFFFNVQR